MLPPDSSGIVALFEERWVEDVERALAKADKVTTHAVDTDSAEKVKATATSGGQSSDDVGARQEPLDRIRRD